MATTILSAVRPAVRRFITTQTLRMAPPVLAARLHQTAQRLTVFKSTLSDVTLVEETIPEYVFGLSTGPVSKYGDMVALSVGNDHVTYNQLKHNVLRFAQSLQQDFKIKEGTVIALFLFNCPEFIVSTHGALAAGAVVTPASPTCTAWELAYQLKDSGATMLVTEATQLPTVVEANRIAKQQVKHIIVVGEAPNSTHVPYKSMLTNDGSLWQPVPVDIHKDMALLPYSSGTTGSPKGVVLTHFNLVSNIVQVTHPDLYPLTPKNKLVGILPFYHAYGLTLMANAALTLGSSVRCLKKFNPVEFLTYIQDDKLDVLHIVPPIALFLANSPLVDKFDLGSVADVTCGAAPLSKEVTEMLRKKLPNVKVIRQGFGMTEMSPVSHADVRIPNKVKPGSAGVLIPNTSCIIVDVMTGEKLGPCKSGELCCKGPQVMLGYHNNPKATNQTIDRDGWLHTGDIGYMDETGHLFIEDRLKELIKVKGFQVAPAELEGLLVSHEAVSDACVVQKADGTGGERPKAFVVLNPGYKVEAEELLQWTNKHISTYKHLVEVEFIPVIPKSPTGKILRRVLREQEKQK